MTTIPRLMSCALLGIALAAVSPARAESVAECQGMFRAADVNGDGVLTATEIASSDAITGDLADALADRPTVTLEEFVAECRD